MAIKKYHVSKNLFNETYETQYIHISVGEGQFTLSSNCENSQGAALLFFFSGYVTSGGSTEVNGVWSGNPKTFSSVDGYVTIAWRIISDLDPRTSNTMLNAGTSPLPYEPYGNTWQAIPYKRYENGEWVEYNDKKYNNGSWD